MKFLLGTKEKMTEVFDEEGRVYPVTVLKLSPIVVTQLKSKEKDGYEAIQVGFGTKSPKKINKAIKGHVRGLGNFLYLKEVKMKGDEGIKVGDNINSTIEAGDKVTISAISKGKGFQGVVKRHGFHGGPRSHGQKHSEREPGSIGTAGFQRVFKAKRMAGRMGSDRITIKNLLVVSVDNENNELLLRGAVPGRRGTMVEVKAFS